VHEERAVYEAGVLRLVQLTPGRSSDAASWAGGGATGTGAWGVVLSIFFANVHVYIL
jgi:hypothetical protein